MILGWEQGKGVLEGVIVLVWVFLRIHEVQERSKKSRNYENIA